MVIQPDVEQWLYYRRQRAPDLVLHLLADGTVGNRPTRAEAAWALTKDGTFVFRDPDGRDAGEPAPADGRYSGRLRSGYSAELLELDVQGPPAVLPVLDSRHGTHPVVLHAPGRPRNPALRQASLLVFGGRPLHLGCPPSLTILTWSDRPQPTLLETCIAHLGVPCRVLRPQAGAGWANSSKIPLAVEALRSVTTEYVLGLDALEVLLLASPSVALERFLALTGGPSPRLPGCRLLYNAELNAFPDHGRVMRLERKLAQEAGELPFAHFNAGAFIGETEACRRWYTCASRHPAARRGRSDQGVFRQFYLDTGGEIRIDRRCEIFQSAIPSQRVRIRPGVSPRCPTAGGGAAT